jgi:hypothetical protein
VPQGPAPVRLISPNGDQIPPVIVQVDGPPPVIVRVTNAADILIDENHPVKQGGTIIVMVSGLTDSSGNPAPLSRVQVNVVTTENTVTPEAIVGELPSSLTGSRQLQVALSSTTPYGPAQGLRVAVETRESTSKPIWILPQ